MRRRRCEYCGLIADRYDLNGDHDCMFSSCPQRDRERRQRERVMRVAAITTFLIGLSLILTFLTAWPARASECYSVRDHSKRMECLAIERGEPADCLGVSDPDKRVICRSRAEQSKRSRQWR